MNKLIYCILFLLSLIPNVYAINYCDDASIVGCYLMYTGTGTTMYDSSFNNRSGTFNSNGKPAWSIQIPIVKYKIPYSLYYSATTDRISLSTQDTTTFKPGQAQSIAFWFYSTTATINNDGFTARILSKNSTAESTIAVGNTGAATGRAIQLNINGTTNLSVVTSNNVWAINTWNHVVITWDGSTTATNVDIYVNGTETTYQTQQNGVSLTDQSGGILYVGNNSLGNRQLNGYLTDLATFSRVLTSTEVSDIYTNGLMPATIISGGTTEYGGTINF